MPSPAPLLDLAAVAADFNGDTALRIVYGDRAFSLSGATSIGTDSVTLVALGDFNGNDLCGWDSAEDGSLTTFIADGAGGFTSGHSRPTGRSVRCLLGADLNGDGRADLVVGSDSSMIYSSTN